MMSKYALDRRTFLRGAVGGVLTALALPPLEAMLNVHGTALANGTALPSKLGLWFWGNGVRPERWRPQGMGAQWTPSEELMPLSSLRSKLNVVSNYAIKHNGTAHHRGRAGILTGTYSPTKGTYGNPTGPSLTHIASNRWMSNPETATRHRSMDVGIAVRGKSTSQNNPEGIVDDSGTFLRPERNPNAIFDLFFEGFEPTADPRRVEAARRARSSALDALQEDTRTLNQRLGAADRQRLESHLEGFRSLERNLAAYDRATCELNLVKPGSREMYYVDGRTPGRELLREKNDIMSDMIALALACDLTHTFSVIFSTMQSDVVFWQIGATEGSHVMTHDDRGLAERLDPQYENVHKSVVFIMENFASLLRKLDAVPIGAGTLLDQCCIMATSEINDGTSHTYNSMPIVLAGGANGKLRTGLHVDGQGRVATDVLLTCLRAVGHDVPQLGDEVGFSNQHINDLMIMT